MSPGPAALSWPRPRAGARGLTTLGAIVGGAAGLVLGLDTLIWGTPFRLEIPQLLAMAGGVSLHLDRLGAFFLVVVEVVAIPSALFGGAYSRVYEGTHSLRLLGAMLNLFLLALSLVPLADNVVTFLLLWELMSVASYFLVLTESDQRETRQAGLWYLAMAHGGLVLLMAAFLLMAASAPSTGFADLRSAASALPRPCAQCRVPAGAPRIRVEGRPRPAPRVAAARASRRPEPRVGADVRRHDQDGRLRAAARHPRPARRAARPGGAGLVLAAGRRLRAPRRALRADGARPQAAARLSLRREHRDHLHRDRRGHDVPELRAARPWPRSGSWPALYHTLNHACFKGLLFLGAGAVLHATGTRNMEEMGGLIKRMPRTAFCFLVGCGARSPALPPLNGFASEWLVFQALLGGPAIPQPEVAVAHAARGGDAGAHQRPGRRVLRQGLRHHLPRHARARAAPTQAHEAPVVHAARAWASLAVACVALGAPALARRAGPRLAPSSGLGGRARRLAMEFAWACRCEVPGDVGQMSPAAPGALGLVLLLARAAWRSGCWRADRRLRVGDTWGCGRIGQTPRMEYTATAFAEPLRRVFAELLPADRGSRRSTSIPSRNTSSQSIEYRSEIASLDRAALSTTPRRVVPAPDGLPRAAAPGGIAPPLPAST